MDTAMPETSIPVALPETLITSSPAVRLMMAVSAAPSPVPLPGPQVEVYLGHARTTEVIEDDGVGAAPGSDVYIVDTVDVHDDSADVSGEEQPTAVG
jgi:hypothetical protein